MNILELILITLAAYLGLGIIIACLYLIKAIHKVDQTAISTSLGFKLIIFPGLAMLWPIMLMKWSKA